MKLINCKVSVLVLYAFIQQREPFFFLLVKVRVINHIFEHQIISNFCDHASFRCTDSL